MAIYAQKSLNEYWSSYQKIKKIKRMTEAHIIQTRRVTSLSIHEYYMARIKKSFDFRWCIVHNNPA